MLQTTPIDILGSFGITGNIAALVVGAYYGYKFWGERQDRLDKKKPNGENGHREQLERERALFKIKEHVDDRAEFVRKEVEITRHAIRQEIQAGFSNEEDQLDSMRGNINGIGERLAAEFNGMATRMVDKMDGIREAILKLPNEMRRS